MENVSYSHFAKKYEHIQISKVPKKYKEKDDLEDKETNDLENKENNDLEDKENSDLEDKVKDDLEELDYIDLLNESPKKNRPKLPKYIRLDMPNGNQWMKK